VDEEFAAQQFEILISTLAENGFEQYEISNFARNQRYSRHNTSYWKQEPYLGVGPAAHSYDGASRAYNISSNAKYLESLQNGLIPATTETLTMVHQTNEYLLTGLRTKWGVQKAKLESLSNKNFHLLHHEDIRKMTEIGWIYSDQESIYLTAAGKLFADKVASDLFI
jgi:oxygen-independent coproporphyrinogen-3 oxidase